MKFQHEERNTPTFRQWAKTANIDPKSSFVVTRVFVNSDWRTVTFVTDDFRINLKQADSASFEKVQSDLHKIIRKPCVCVVRVSDRDHAEVELVVASDANEHAQQYEQDDLGYALQ